MALPSIPGDVLLARRARGVCIVCGVTAMPSFATSDDPDRVCVKCLLQCQPPRKFNRAQNKQKGLANLDKLLAGLPLSADVDLIRSPLCARLDHCGFMAERGAGVKDGTTLNCPIRCLQCGRTGTESRKIRPTKGPDHVGKSRR